MQDIPVQKNAISSSASTTFAGPSETGIKRRASDAQPSEPALKKIKALPTSKKEVESPKVLKVSSAKCPALTIPSSFGPYVRPRLQTTASTWKLSWSERLMTRRIPLYLWNPLTITQQRSNSRATHRSKNSTKMCKLGHDGIQHTCISILYII